MRLAAASYRFHSTPLIRSCFQFLSATKLVTAQIRQLSAGMGDTFVFVINPGNEVWQAIAESAAKHDGWKLTEDDYSTWRESFGDNFRFLAALDKESKEVAGCVSTGTYRSIDGSKELTAVGNFNVLPKYRGAGIGIELFERIMDQQDLAENKVLVAAPSMSKKYSDRFHFGNFGERGRVVSATLSEADPSRLPLASSGTSVVDASNVEWSKLVAYDKGFAGGVDREAYLRNFMRQKDAHAKVAVDASGSIVGLGVIRECIGDHLVVGPLYAVDEVTAASLLRSLVTAVTELKRFSTLSVFPYEATYEATIRMINTLSNGKAEASGMFSVQFTREILQVPSPHVYGITEFAMSFV